MRVLDIVSWDAISSMMVPKSTASKSASDCILSINKLSSYYFFYHCHTVHFIPTFLDMYSSLLAVELCSPSLLLTITFVLYYRSLDFCIGEFFLSLGCLYQYIFFSFILFFLTDTIFLNKPSTIIVLNSSFTPFPFSSLISFFFLSLFQYPQYLFRRKSWSKCRVVICNVIVNSIMQIRKWVAIATLFPHED